MIAGTIAIVGCGLVGCDVAAVFLAAGWRVHAVEPDVPSWGSRCGRVVASLAQLAVWPEIQQQLRTTLALEAKTIFAALQRQHPERLADILLQFWF